MFMGFIGKHPQIMGCLRGHVELCKTYYGIFSGRVKDKVRKGKYKPKWPERLATEEFIWVQASSWSDCLAFYSLPSLPAKFYSKLLAVQC